MWKKLVVGALVVVPSLALAQPGGPGSPADGEPTGTQPGPTPPQESDPNADDARIKEIVDRELARVLTERAAKEAAEAAAKEAAAKETTAATSDEDLTGNSGFMDTRLAFTLTHENVLAKPGETIPSAPGLRFGVPNSLGVLFFDNYDTRFSGFETLTHAVAYRRYNKDHLEVEGSFVLRINELSENNIALSDAGSYITVSNWKDPTHKDPTRISLTAFPVSSDRFRLGYSYRLSWGGTPEYRRSKSSTPGAKLQYDWNGGYAFLGAKTGTLVDPTTNELRGHGAGLGGFGIDPTDMVRFELQGGFFDRGYLEKEDVKDQRNYLFGGSAQVTIHKDTPIRSSVDYRLYKFNNERVAGLFNPEKYPGGVSWLVQAEATAMGQTLKDPDSVGDTVVQTGFAGDINVRVKIDRIRLRLDVSYRDLAFILHSQPSLPPYVDFSSDYEVKPNFFAALGVDRNWNDFLTLGLIVGIDRPASLASDKSIPGVTETERSTAVFRNNNIDTLISILPSGETTVPQIATKITAKLDFGRIFTTLFEAFYVRDDNVTTYERDPACAEDPDLCNFNYVFGNANQLGFNATLQARF